MKNFLMMWENSLDILLSKKKKKQNVEVYLQFLWLHYEGLFVTKY